MTNQILIVIEIKTHSLLKGLAKNQMEIIMSDADADYGMIFNGKEKLCIERKIRSSHQFYFLPILDIPSSKSIEVSLPSLSITFNRIIIFSI